jgi:LAS superfamily LD-carboxypeptidase LdcB
MHKFISSIVLFLFAVTFQQSEIYSKAELIGKAPMNHYENEYKVRKEVYDAFNLMQSEALKDGIDIEIVSSYRSFEHQKRIWTRKYSKYISQGFSPQVAIDKIIEYSTIPGTSRHHWGTDIDIIDGSKAKPKDVLLTQHFKKEGIYHALKKWLDINAGDYGFYLVYTNDSERRGFKYEPWHYSYTSTSSKMLNEFLKISLKEMLLEEEIVGSENFTQEFLNQYLINNVLDINPDLK